MHMQRSYGGLCKPWNNGKDLAKTAYDTPPVLRIRHSWLSFLIPIYIPWRAYPSEMSRHRGDR